MSNFMKICKMLAVAAFVCVCFSTVSSAQMYRPTEDPTLDRPSIPNFTAPPSIPGLGNNGPNSTTYLDENGKQVTFTEQAGKPNNYVEQNNATTNYTINDVKVSKEEYDTYMKKVKPETPASTSSTNAPANSGQVSGCTKDLGLFSGLINTGQKIFTGLRDLIYVVAGFGIIGVAVGGFFGNLNWKWLGAIIIGLVVIATTGELINAITGCEQYTSAVIQDTLK